MRPRVPGKGLAQALARPGAAPGIAGARWRVLLGRAVSLRDAVGLIGIGYLISGVLPLRAGDPARAVGAGLRGTISALGALSTVVVERVLDMLLIVLSLLATVPFVPGLQTYLATGQINDFLSYNLILTLSGILAVGILVLFVLIAVFPKTTESLARRVLELFPISNVDRWLKPVQSVVQGLSALRSIRDGLEIGAWSVALWAVTGLYFGTTLQACRAFIPDPSVLKSLVAVWSSAFGMVFPATGGIGSFHFAVREALFWGFDIARDLGFTYAVIVHAIPYLTGIALGALTLLLWGMSPGKLISRGQDIEA